MMAALSARLAEDGDQIEIVTTQGTHPANRREIRQFLKTHNPMMLIHVGGALDLATLQACEAEGLRIVLLDADEATLTSLTPGWFPRKNKGLLTIFDDVFAPDAKTASALIDAGAPYQHVQVVGPFEPNASVLPYSEAERLDIAGALLTRRFGWPVA